MDELLALSVEQLETLLKRLTHHALRKMLRLTWRGAYVSKNGAVPGAREPQDFANDAIQKLLDGTRPWNKTRYKTLEDALRATIDSDISHLVDSLDNILGRRLGVAKDETEKAYEVPGTEPDPVTVVVDKDWMERFHKAALKELAGEKMLERLFECLEADITKPAEVAVILETTVEEVNNLQKRLRRKLDKLDPQFRPSTKKRVTS